MMITTLFVLLFVLLLMGVPVAISLGLSVLTSLLIFADFPMSMIGQKVAGNIAHFPLMAIPFFMISSAIMLKGGVTKRLINLARALVGHVPGGLAIASILSCMIFASISGSSAATVVAIGSIMIPAMLEAGYARRFSVGVVATGGSLGILIPPSIAMIIYGFVTETSVPKLFMAGLLPGIFLGATLMLVSYVIARMRNFPLTPPTTGREKLLSFKESFWALTIPIVILGGIYGLPRPIEIGAFKIDGGAIFTPTEAAVVSIFLALFVSIHIYKDLKWSEVPQILIDVGSTIGMLLFIIINAVMFGFVLGNEGVPHSIAAWIVANNLTPVTFLLLVNIVLFFAGDFMDATPIILIFIPILFPSAMALGIDPIHFGIIVVVNMELGAITPPIGMNLFMASTVSGMPLYDVMIAALPWTLVIAFVLIVITYVPWISTVLPQLYFG